MMIAMMIVVLMSRSVQARIFHSMFGADRLGMITSMAIQSTGANQESQSDPLKAKDIVDTNDSENNTSLSYRRKRPPKRMVVSFVNGIYHTEAEWQEICDELKVLFKQPEIRPFYNPVFWVLDA